jgi:adenylylsulfate kinase-like enzyme
MIIWITGEHNAGKTTLAHYLLRALGSEYDVVHIDGDEWREFTGNYDYSESGRRRNVETAMDNAINIIEKSDGRRLVICSFMSPYKDMREELRRRTSVLEVFVKTTRKTATPWRLIGKHQRPQEGHLEICADHFGDAYWNQFDLIYDRARKLMNKQLHSSSLSHLDGGGI